MKLKKQILIFFCVLFQSSVFSQLTEGYFQYHIEVKASDTLLETKQKVAMLRQSNMELYFAPKKSRIDFKMGNLKMTSIIVDRESNKTLMISDGIRGKIAKIGEAKDVKAIKKDPNASVKFVNESKVILGYKCKKIILTQNNISTTYWCTEDIKIDSKSIQQIINPNLPGFPLEFSKTQNGVLMIFKLSNMRDHLIHAEDTVFFTTPPQGFKVIKSPQQKP